MTNVQGILVVLALFCQLALSVWSSVSPPTPAPVVAAAGSVWPVAPAPSRWAYRIEVIPDTSFTETMNAIGAEGWTLVSARRANTAGRGEAMEMAYEAIFQRPIAR